MKLILPTADGFGGIIPRTRPEALPDMGAQTATNVDLTNGRLVPLSVTGTVAQWHDETNRLSQIASADFFQVGTPAAPTVASTDRIFSSRLLTITEYIYVTYINASNEFVVEEVMSFNMMAKRSQWTDYGVSLYFSKRQAVSYTVPNNGKTYTFYGPRFRVRYGNKYLPLDEPTYTDPIIPAGRIALVNPLDDDQQYGELEVIDYSGPSWDVTDWIHESGAAIIREFPPHGITLNFNLNYTYPKRRTFYYVQSKVTDDAVAGEGPASDISEPVIVEPGMEVTLNVIEPGKLYRSETQGDDFLLIDDLTTATLELDNGDGTGTYVDRRAVARGTVLPPYGDYPTGATRVGSVVSPAGFAAIFYTNTVYISDIARHWVYPEEWTIEFPTNIMALEVVGGTILVWTAAVGATEPGKIFALTGSNPESIAKIELSATHPLLDARSICKIGGTCYYVTTDGLAATNGGPPQLVTANHYTRVQWSALTPANFKSKVADDSVFLYGSSTNLRIDLQEELVRVTVWTALTGGTITWKSKLFAAPKAWRPTSCRVRAATYPVTVKLYSAGSGTATATLTIADGEAFRLEQFKPERLWEVQVESAYVVDEVSLASSMEELRNG